MSYLEALSNANDMRCFAKEILYKDQFEHLIFNFMYWKKVVGIIQQ